MPDHDEIITDNELDQVADLVMDAWAHSLADGELEDAIDLWDDRFGE